MQSEIDFVNLKYESSDGFNKFVRRLAGCNSDQKQKIATLRKWN